MISNNYIPEKINDANAYLDGTRMIGVAASVDLPEVNMKTGTVEGFGVGGEIDSPTIGQWESFEQEVQFNTLYSSAVDMLNPLTVVNLTFRAAQQVYDKTGGYDFKGLRVVEMGRVKKFKARSEWVGPKLKSYTFDLLLRAQDGVPPRSTLDYFQRMAESSAVDWFVVGGVPLSPYPFKITDISETWDAVLQGGVLVECKVSLTIEEYL